MTKRKKSVIPQGPCKNCGTFVDTPFCPQCGQKNRDYTLSLKDLLGEFIEELLDVDARFLQSLKALFFKPGSLTNAYLQGRRVHFLSPVRLYLFPSVLFFLILSLRALWPEIHDSAVMQQWRDSGDFGSSIELVVDSLSQTVADSTARVPNLDQGETLTLTASGSEMDISASDFWSSFQDNFAKILFFLLPVAALLLKLLYIRRKRVYLEHLVFSLHVHAFIFSLLVLTALFESRILVYAILVLSMFYLFLAMREVYRQSIAKTLSKLILLLLSYGLVLGLGFLITLITTALFMVIGQGT